MEESVEKLMIEDFFEGILNEVNIEPNDVNQYSPLVLAYIGDTVYEIFIRSFVLSEGNVPVHKLHRKAVHFVKAKAQSDVIHGILDNLTPEEQNIVRRGRNAKSGTIPKNADVTEYKYATGFESLLGFLFLKREYTRLIEILKMAVSEVRT